MIKCKGQAEQLEIIRQQIKQQRSVHDIRRNTSWCVQKHKWEPKPHLDEVVRQQKEVSPRKSPFGKREEENRMIRDRGEDWRDVPFYAYASGIGHVGMYQMLKNSEHWLHPFLKQMVTYWVNTCEFCLQYTTSPPLKPEPGRFPVEPVAGREIILDFKDMVISVRGYKCVFMCVDACTGWPEAWPTKRENSKTVIKCLVNHYIPRHGFPIKVWSNNGTCFKTGTCRLKPC